MFIFKAWYNRELGSRLNFQRFNLKESFEIKWKIIVSCQNTGPLVEFRADKYARRIFKKFYEIKNGRNICLLGQNIKP